ncbi:hypothetical protein PAEPH01_0258 [Pancytospora epiphaga]|nr:hypothetical protein PAEPH01_0258 [Pancytospora epiphaga]
MKTRTFKVMRFIITSLSIILIVTTLFLCGYLVRHVTFVQIEAEVMKNSSSVLTILNISKATGFLYVVLGFLASYSMNIPSKLLMLLVLYLGNIMSFGIIYTIYYLGFEYQNHFSSILDSEFYSRAGLIGVIKTWKPSLSAVELKSACKDMMGSMIFVLIMYEVIAISSMFTISGFLILTRRMDIELKSLVADAPPISELSRVGLNTCSLRNKRILVEP